MCRARKDFRRAGMLFLMLIFGSPKRTICTRPLGPLTYTADFFFPPGVLNGLFRLTFLPLYSAMAHFFLDFALRCTS